MASVNHPGYAQMLVKQGWSGYQGWGDDEAYANFQETGGEGKRPAGGSSSVQTPEQVAQGIIDAQAKQIKEETSYLEKYTTENPFVFDEAFAKESATQEYEPYYQRLLQDYLSKVEPQRASIKEESKLLQDLYKLDTTGRTNTYDRAVTSAEEGFAGKGLFFSGINKRAVGEKTVDYGLAGEGAEKKYTFGQNELGRETGALNLEERMNRRDIGEQQTAAIEGGILKRQKEAQVKYYTPMVQSYFRRFPASTSSALAGYAPSSYLSF